MRIESIKEFLCERRAVSRRVVRRCCILVQQALLVAAIVLFVRSLREPALVVDPWCNGHTTPNTGWECLLWGIYFYPSNALLVLLPVVALLLTRARRPVAQIVVAVLSTVSTAWVVAFFFGQAAKDIHVGCLHWVRAHELSTMALLLPVHRGRRPRRSNRDARPGGFPVITQTFPVPCAPADFDAAVPSQ